MLSSFADFPNSCLQQRKTLQWKSYQFLHLGKCPKAHRPEGANEVFLQKFHGFRCFVFAENLECVMFVQGLDHAVATLHTTFGISYE
jgi:hypothetical protein